MQAATSVGLIIIIYLGALCYADDLTLLVPTAAALRILLTICEEYANERAMIFNADKSKCIVFKPRSVALQARPTFSIAGQVIDYTSSCGFILEILSAKLRMITSALLPDAFNSLFRLIMFWVLLANSIQIPKITFYISCVLV
jgi:hypothetical protein